MWEPPKCDAETQSEQMPLEKIVPIYWLTWCRTAKNLPFVKTQYLQSAIKWNTTKWGALYCSLNKNDADIFETLEKE